MWRIIITVILFGIVYWIIKQALFPKRQKTRNFRGEGETLVQDPVCKCYVPQSQAVRIEFKGKRFFFCSEECHKKFLALNIPPKN
jgi:YHS domain-containing protein